MIRYILKIFWKILDGQSECDCSIDLDWINWTDGVTLV